MNEPGIKDRIIKGAGELFVRYGVRSITMDDIAHHLGISKKTLYQHFSDKDDIVASAMSSYISKRCTEFESLRSKVANAIEELVLMSERLKESVKNANPSMLFDLQKYHQRAWELWKTYRNKYIRESLMKNLKEGIQQGFYREDIDPEIVATIRLEMIQIGFDEHIFPREEFSVAEVQTQLLEHFTQGILTSKGKKLYDKYKTELAESANN
jgi:AcrR family transcriptional regulator